MDNTIISAILAALLAAVGIGPSQTAPSLATDHIASASVEYSYAAGPGADKPSPAQSSAASAEPQVQALSPEPPGEPLLTFPVLSDVHVQASDAASQNKFKAALNDLYAIRPQADALVLNGDSTDGKPQDYALLSRLMRQLPHPDNTFYTIGNHEYYKAWYNANSKWSPESFPNGETEAASIERFLAFTGKTNVYYDETVKGYHFIFLGSERYQQSDPNYNEDAYLSAEQLAWLKQTLAKDTDPRKPVFIFLHQPLPGTVAGTDYWAYTRSVIQYKELTDILRQYPQTVFFSGHTHWDLTLPGMVSRKAFTAVNTSSVNEPYTLDANGYETEMPAEASQGVVVELYEDRLIVKGRDFYGKRWIPEAEHVIPLPAAAKP